MKILTVTNLFPNPFEPRRGIFNLFQIKALTAHADVRVVAPVPKYPGMSLLGARASSGRVGDVAAETSLAGLAVHHPRYLSIPFIGRPLAGWLYYRGTRRLIARLHGEEKADVLFATWAYPDGYASSLIARDLDLPFVLKVHGSDINAYLRSATRRRMIATAMQRCRRIVAVSEDLAGKLVDGGVPREKIAVIYNGVDAAVFSATDRAAAREQLGLDADGRHILFVGNLVTGKGLDTLIDAVHVLAQGRRVIRVHIVGYGVMRNALQKRIENEALGDRVALHGDMDPEGVARWMNASDVLCLPSRAEGVPNVVLEALSCGTPVVATGVGGIPEIVNGDHLGILVPPNRADALGQALVAALDRQWNRSELTERASEFTWERNARELAAILNDSR